MDFCRILDANHYLSVIQNPSFSLLKKIPIPFTHIVGPSEKEREAVYAIVGTTGVTFLLLHRYPFTKNPIEIEAFVLVNTEHLFKTLQFSHCWAKEMPDNATIRTLSDTFLGHLPPSKRIKMKIKHKWCSEDIDVNAIGEWMKQVLLEDTA